MSLLSYRSTPEPSDVEQQKVEYLRGRVLDQRDHYFGRHHPDAEKRKRWLSRVGFYAATTAPLFIGLALLLKLFAPDWIAKNYFAAGAALFLPFAVPLLAGAATSLVLAMDVGRRAERYRDVGARLDRIARLIPGLKTRGALSRIVAETEEMLLDELVEWYAAAKQTAQ